MTALLLNTIKAGNVRGQTMRAFTAAEMAKILVKGDLARTRRRRWASSAGPSCSLALELPYATNREISSPVIRLVSTTVSKQQSHLQQCQR